ncbi:MAG: hydroxyacid dehydrogenase, partial [Clostridia bacterium]|nr:hydroxyacid dehydrogenase [Clostridia bacterium]
ADVVVLNKIKITRELIDNAKKLKLVCVTATGYDNIDINECRKNNIAVCNVVGYSTNSVAQVTLAIVLSLSVNLPSFNDYVKSGEYTKSGIANKLTPVYSELCGKTWGIVGYGNIGKQVGNIAKALGCRVIVNKRTPCNDVECVDLETLCKEADVITVHTPLNDGTREIINKKTLALMKKNVILVNVARGAVLNENDVCNAIINGEIGAFGCDVYSTEPFSSEHLYNKIMNMENVILTPHMAWGAYEARERCINEVAKNIKAFFAGDIRNRVDL